MLMVMMQPPTWRRPCKRLLFRTPPPLRLLYLRYMGHLMSDLVEVEADDRGAIPGVGWCIHVQVANSGRKMHASGGQRRIYISP